LLPCAYAFSGGVGKLQHVGLNMARIRFFVTFIRIQHYDKTNSTISKYSNSMSKEVFLAPHIFLSLYLFFSHQGDKVKILRESFAPPAMFHNMSGL